MTNLRKAAEMALNALNIQTPLNNREFELRNSAIEALRQALAQPEQEPLVWMNKYGHVSSEQTEEYNAPLYTAPPKREWVGLTDEQQHEFVRNYGGDVISKLALVKAIEAKLNEKNT